MNEVAIALSKIASVSSRNTKLLMLRNYENLVGFKEIIKFIYNPYIRTGIAKAKLNKKVPPVKIPISWQDFINYFTVHQTGSDTDVAMAQAFIAQQESDEAYTLAIAMATKDLKIGCTENTFNQLWGDAFIPKIGIMRGEHYGDFKSKVKGPFIVTEKLDGGRRLIVKEKGVVTMYSRSGHLDEGLVDIEREAKLLPDDSVFDTELLAIGEFANSIELRQASLSIANSKGIRHGVTANVFDMIPLADFKRGMSVETAVQRKVALGALFGDTSIRAIAGVATDEIIAALRLKHSFEFIKPVPILGVANTEDEVFAFAQPIWDRQFEGVMLNTFDGRYEVKATPVRQLLKVKATEEFKLKCTGIYEGEKGSRLEGTTGGLYLDYKGYKLGCGSGLNDAIRAKIWANPSVAIGKWIEGDSFGESKNQAGGLALNCPIFKRIAGDAE